MFVLAKKEQETLRRAERKIVRRVYGPAKGDDECRIINNHKIDEQLKREDIVRFVQAQRIQ